MTSMKVEIRCDHCDAVHEAVVSFSEDRHTMCTMAPIVPEGWRREVKDMTALRDSPPFYFVWYCCPNCPKE